MDPPQADDKLKEIKMFNFSKQTKSFVTLLFIAAIAVIASYYITRSLEETNYNVYKNTLSLPQLQEKIGIAAKQTQDAKGEWTNYKDKRYNLSFSYPKNWSLKTFREDRPNGLYVIALDPGKGAEMIRIYVSSENYFALEGLPVKKTTIAGKSALEVAGMLIGIKDAAYYYTFDLGGNITYQPEFQSMVDKVAFQK